MIRLQSAPHTTRLCCTLIYLATHNMHKPQQQRDYASSAQVQNKLPSLCLACGMSLQQPIHRFAAHLLFDFWANTAPTPSAGQVLPPAGGGGHNHTATPPPKPKQCDCAQPRTPNSKTPAHGIAYGRGNRTDQAPFGRQARTLGCSHLLRTLGRLSA